jgi:hypothetical protein
VGNSSREPYNKFTGKISSSIDWDQTPPVMSLREYQL